MGPAFGLLGVIFLVGLVLQHIVFRMVGGEPGRMRVVAVVVGLAVFSATLAAGWRTRWQRFLASNRTSVPVLVTLTFLSVLGTLILQNEPESVLRGAYGSALSVIQALFLHDVFHSFGFTAILGLGAGALALVVTRKRRWNARYAGSVAAHLGLILVLAGASIGIVWGVKGRVNLHTGESSDRIFVPSGKQVHEIPLGFTVHLDDFRLEHYVPEFRLMVFDVSSKKEKLLASVDPLSPQANDDLRRHGIELMDYWPDHVRETVVEPLAQPPPGPRLAALRLGHREGSSTWIFDDGSSRGGSLQTPAGLVKFFWEAKRAEGYLETIKTSPAAPRHVVVVKGEEIPVEVGQSHPVPGTDLRFEVVQALVDFVIDVETRKPLNRSDQPNNPAIEVVLKDAQGKEVGRKWLFAKYPDFHGKETDPRVAGMAYRYAGGEGQNPAAFVIAGETLDLWIGGEDGKAYDQGKAEVGKPLLAGRSDLVIGELHAAVRRSFRDKSKSKRADNPVARVTIERVSGPRSLKPKQPLRLDDRTVLVLAPKGGESVRDYLSVLSVYEERQKVMTKTVEVNDPLAYGGYVFYQTDYRPEDPTFSGFQVVRDPGLWIVYLGFFVNMVGVVLAIFLPPMLRRRKRALAAGGQAS